MPTVKEIAQLLAKAHREADPSTTEVWFFPDNEQQTVRLLEVSSSVPAVGEVLPFRFEPDVEEGIIYPSVVILLHPVEWRKVHTGDIKLPLGWDQSVAESL